MIEEGVVVHEVRYPHPIEEVWRAITDPASIAAWLMPNDFVAEAGHQFELDARPALGIVEGEVVDIQPPNLLRCAWVVQGTLTTVTIRLEQRDDFTLLRLEHESLPPHLLDFDAGWHDKLEDDLLDVLRGTRSYRDSRVQEGLYRHPALDHSN